MHLSTLVFFGLLAFFTWRGYQKGFIQSITRILSWIVAYPAAIFFTKPLARWLIDNTALDGLLVYFIAGCGIFLVVSLLVSLLLNTLAKLIPESQTTEVTSRIGGAGVGVFIGSILGLVAVYLLGLVVTPPAANPAPELEVAHAQPDTPSPVEPAAGVPKLRDLEKTQNSFIEASAKKLIGSAAATAVDLALDDKTTTQVTKAFAEDPQTMFTHVQQVANNGDIQKLMADEKVQSLMTTGDTQALIREPAFQELMDNPSVQALMAQADVKSGDGAEAAAEKMVTAWNRVQTLRHDPRVIAIITDPEFQQQLNSPNKLQLMMNPKLNQLTEIIFSNDTSPATKGATQYQIRDINTSESLSRGQAAPINNPPAAEDDEKSPTTIYRWTDEKGQVHYSDKPIQK